MSPCTRNLTLVLFLLILLTLRNALGNIVEIEDEISEEQHKRYTRQAISDEMLAAALDPGVLVKKGFFCKKLPIEVNSKSPEVGESPVKYTFYYIDETTPNTIHMVVESQDPSFLFDYLVVMAVNEGGVPIGHFHLLVCDQGAKRSGQWNLGNRCNKGKDRDRSIRRAYGNPHIMYVEREPPNGQKLSIQSIFWSWIPGDYGRRPVFIQFRLAVIQKSETGGKDKFWVTYTPQVEFFSKWKFIAPLDSEGEPDLDTPSSDDKDTPERCYDNPMKADSPGNFQLTDETEEIPVNIDYLKELFPVWFRSSKKKIQQRILRVNAEIHKEMKKTDLTKERHHFMYAPSMKSVIAHSTSHKEIYAGCLVVKNCIGDTEICVDEKNCISLVTYRDMQYYLDYEDFYRFELQVYLPKKLGYGYAALGISLDSQMGNDSVVECSVDKSGAAGVYSSWNLEYDNKRTSGNCTRNGTVGENIKHCKLALRNNILACSFHLRKALYLPGEVKMPMKSFNLEKSNFYIFHASGTEFVSGTSQWKTLSRRQMRARKKGRRSSRNHGKRPKRDLFRKILPSGSLNNAQSRGSETTGIGKHDVTFKSAEKLDLKELEEIEKGSEKLKYIKWHATIVIVAFMALLPNGVYVARYFKETWTAAMIFNMSIWRVVHGAYMISVLILIFVDAIMIFSFHDAYEIGSSGHRKCGYIIYVLLAIQPFLGVGTSYVKSASVNYTIRVVHWAIGTIVKIFASIIIAVAPFMIKSRFFIGVWVICLLEILFVIFMHVLMTVSGFLCY